MIALKMIEMMEYSVAHGTKPRVWRMRPKTLASLVRQSRHTGDVRIAHGRSTFLNVPIEIADVRNSFGAELTT